MIKSVTHITIFVSNQDEALAFYCDKLGFEKNMDMPYEFEGMKARWLTVSPQGQKGFEIALVQAATDEQKALVGKQGSNTCFLCVGTDNVQKEYEDFKAKGVELSSEPTQRPWGIDFVCKDLYGNMIDVIEPLDCNPADMQ